MNKKGYSSNEKDKIHESSNYLKWLKMLRKVMKMMNMFLIAEEDQQGNKKLSNVANCIQNFQSMSKQGFYHNSMLRL